MNAAEIKNEVRKLSPLEKYELLRELSRDLHSLGEEEIEALQVQEAEARLEELRSGKVTAISGTEFRQRRQSL